MLQIMFVAEIYESTLSTDDCDNVGPCCLSCPMYDACDHHYEESEGATEY